MKKINLSKSGLLTSELALGMWHINKLSGQELNTLLDTAWDHEITCFDHADIYGSYTCEEAFGPWMKAHASYRDKMQLVSKCGIKLISAQRPAHRVKHYDTSSQHIQASVDNSLKALQTDYLDLLLIHRPDPLMNAEEVASAFSNLHQQGKVKFFGVSNFTNLQFDLLQEACDQPIVTNQMEVSLYHHSPMTDGTLDHMQRLNITPMAWSPLGGANNILKAIQEPGLKTLAKKYELSVGDLVLQWLMIHPANILPVLGTMRQERVISAVKSLGTKIDREDWFEMLKIAAGKDVA